jgi:putative FmdB family regulatory protein
MPKYDYHCENCDLTYELKLPFGSSVDQECNECNKTARRLLTPPALVFKGSGFYKTSERASDSDGKAEKTKSKGTNKPATETKPSDSSSSSTNDSKPSSTNDSKPSVTNTSDA